MPNSLKSSPARTPEASSAMAAARKVGMCIVCFCFCFCFFGRARVAENAIESSCHELREIFVEILLEFVML